MPWWGSLEVKSRLRQTSEEYRWMKATMWANIEHLYASLHFILQADNSLCLLTMFKKHCRVSCGSNYKVQLLSWQVWDRQLSRFYVCFFFVFKYILINSRLPGVKNDCPHGPRFSECRIVRGKGWHEFVLQEAQLLSGQCSTTVCRSTSHGSTMCYKCSKLIYNIPVGS